MLAARACKLMSRLVSDCHLNKTVDGKVISVTKKKLSFVDVMKSVGYAVQLNDSHFFKMNIRVACRMF